MIRRCVLIVVLVMTCTKASPVSRDAEEPIEEGSAPAGAEQHSQDSDDSSLPIQDARSSLDDQPPLSDQDEMNLPGLETSHVLLDNVNKSDKIVDQNLSLNQIGLSGQQNGDKPISIEPLNIEDGEQNDILKPVKPKPLFEQLTLQELPYQTENNDQPSQHNPQPIPLITPDHIKPRFLSRNLPNINNDLFIAPHEQRPFYNQRYLLNPAVQGLVEDLPYNPPEDHDQFIYTQEVLVALNPQYPASATKLSFDYIPGTHMEFPFHPQNQEYVGPLPLTHNAESYAQLSGYGATSDGILDQAGKVTGRIRDAINDVNNSIEALIPNNVSGKLNSAIDKLSVTLRDLYDALDDATIGRLG